jgi:hypothetical protein
MALAQALTQEKLNMKQLVEDNVKALVDHPEDVQIMEIVGEENTIFEVRTHKNDIGKVIGKLGKTAEALRHILNCCGMKYQRRFRLEIIE